MTIETLNFLRSLLAQVSISAGAANFDEQAATITRVRDELDAAMVAIATPAPTDG